MFVFVLMHNCFFAFIYESFRQSLVILLAAVN